MTNHIVPPSEKEINNLAFPSSAIYAEIARVTGNGDLTVTETSNPHRFVVHPSGWSFRVEEGFVFAFSPGRRLYIVDGVPAMTIIEALTCCVDCGQPATTYIPNIGMICWDCLHNYAEVIE